MATKKFLELKGYSDEELASQLQVTESDYHKLVFDHGIKGLDNPLEIREFRRDIARMKTEIRRRELENMTEVQLANRSNIRRRRKKKS